MARYYASTGERARLIAGFRSLADFLHDHPDVPAPRWADVMVFPPDGTDEEMRAEIDRIAGRIATAITDHTADNGHYTATRAGTRLAKPPDIRHRHRADAAQPGR